ncbi:MAG: serpin family protein [Candidatus Aquicultorales bacterium]
MRKQPFVVVLALLLVMVLAAGCSKYASVEKPAFAATEEDITKSGLSEANTRFGFKLFRELFKEEPDKNIFISPTSIATALQMTYNGSAGKTREAMAKTLELQGMTVDEMNAANAALINLLVGIDPKVELSLANSLWLSDRDELKQSFIDKNREFYAATLDTLDFGSPSAVSTINRWVSDKTKGKITDLIENIDAKSSSLFLVNAIYFNGAWQKEFSPDQLSFSGPDGSSKVIDGMRLKEDMSYFDNEDFQAVSVPYGDGRVSMYLFLPRANKSLGDFHSAFTAEEWDKWMGGFGEIEGTLIMPKFKFEYGNTLDKPLKTLGMEIAFTDRADFSEMGDGLFIGEVRHKAIVEVNEKGTEAAAGTSVEMLKAAAPSSKTFTMILDKPFFFAIRDNKTGVILFMGSVMDPSRP